jgi:hypothetical protein
MSYKVVPISKVVADRVRESMVSPHGGLPAFSSLATGYGPCRSCLRTFSQGEDERIYISYDPFMGMSDLPLPGPVFIHTEACEEYFEDGFPKRLLEIPMIFEGFGENSRLFRSECVEADRLDEQIDAILRVEGVKFIHIRNGEAGCFIARIEGTDVIN